MLVFQLIPIKSVSSVKSDHDIKTAREYYDTAFKIAKQTGDFWVAEKLLQAAVCLDANPRYTEALGDVEMKLGRPTEALLAWQKTVNLDANFAPHFKKRKNEMKYTTSPIRWLQALNQSKDNEWECQDNIPTTESTSSLSTTEKPYTQTLHLFSSPVEVINITAFREHRGLREIDHESLVQIAFQGYQEANRDGAMIDEIHGDLTPNNQFFEYQMSLLNEATVKELNNVMVGWPELQTLRAWKELVDTVRDALRESSMFSQFLPHEHVNLNIDKQDCEVEKKTRVVNGYSWMSMHKGHSTHAKHAHLDARVSVVYYAQLPSEQAKHKIVFYDPRGLSPHQNLRFPNDVIAPPFTQVYSHYPQPGDLVIFPSWLVHEVLPLDDDEAPNKSSSDGESIREAIREDKASEYRVSISFNIGEGWEGTAPP